MQGRICRAAVELVRIAKDFPLCGREFPASSRRGLGAMGAGVSTESQKGLDCIFSLEGENRGVPGVQPPGAGAGGGWCMDRGARRDSIAFSPDGENEGVPGVQPPGSQCPLDTGI